MDNNQIAIGTFYNLGNSSSNFDLTVSESALDKDNSSVSIVLGRGSGCDIRIKDSHISAAHCNIKITGLSSLSYNNGKIHVAISDLSLNGTFINGVKLDPDTLYLLKPNDLVKFGTFHEYIFKLKDIRHLSSRSSNPGDQKSKKKEEARSNRNIFDHYHFTENDIIGKGNFGSVYKARNRQTNELVAVKVVQSTRPEEALMINKEIGTLKSCEHNNIMKIIDQFHHLGTDTSKKKTRTVVNTCLILEYIESGDLYGKVTGSVNSKISEQETMFYFEQILDGICYLHENGIIHRDIKLENILLHKSANPYVSRFNNYQGESYGDIVIKIADFGLSKCLGEELFTKTICGTPQYVAPEILQYSHLNPTTKKFSIRPYGKQVDLWSCGIVLFTCLFGYFPFNNDDPVRDTIKYCESDTLKTISAESVELFQNLLEINPEQRLSSHEALKHSWFNCYNKYANGSYLEQNKENFSNYDGDDTIMNDNVVAQGDSMYGNDTSTLDIGVNVKNIPNTHAANGSELNRFANDIIDNFADYNSESGTKVLGSDSSKGSNVSIKQSLLLSNVSNDSNQQSFAFDSLKLEEEFTKGDGNYSNYF
ncbi:serine/threonine protein kinase [Saccharomycopsis crataegensis]|uniref:non-specific serine/threonine protein kinase n=1 Tax=Saccharomycopsis crataegensis TaxID=43959 RepID=A0AAV5QJ47_9ASCO|nr:serine/threonine protein kinase [Saccharomycopsis crataegensis]